MFKTKFFQKPLMVIMGLALATISTAQPFKAAIFSYQEDTTNEPIWRRVAPGNPPTLISGEKDGNLGMSVPYSVLDFIVKQSGLYTINGESEPTPPANRKWDIFLALYQDSFNPTEQLSNVLIASTTTNGSTVTFNRELLTGQKYFLVTTGRRVNDFGRFSNTISGSGQITPIPESDSISAMLVTGGITLLLYKRKVGFRIQHL
ncbi:PEP-CTERM sorting domain-containing protein [Nostoc sp. LPT]|uniref:PEP-CTERM sorting domain-containing protein n=1 Tax=Nostoc sp. LPT TaxID=2815387 RepID=UPI001DDAD2DF|nr:PEP-CTERM sorting domain-containing protein [Nostoc sp. LPT]MBN4003248.1 PEP-CTERM sorting domain-containing protein [Nostoc sp. LPT]